MPTFYGDAYTPAMLEHFGVTVVVGATTSKGIRDEFGERVLDGEFGGTIANVILVTVRTLDFPALAVGDAMTVDGDALSALEVLKLEDGSLTRVVCTRVS